MKDLLPSPEGATFTAIGPVGEEESFEVADLSPLAAFIFKTREDPYGKISYIRVFGGMLESDSRVWDVNLDTEVRVGTLGAVRGKEQIALTRLHAGDIGAVTKLGDAQTNDTLCDQGHKMRLPSTEQPNPIVSVAVHPVSQSDVAKLTTTLNRIAAEDPTVRWHSEPATRETILSGMGTAHVDIAVKKMESKFGLNLTTSIPKVPYRETITRSNSAEYTHKKQTGGAGQYARVFLRVESLGDDEEFEFDSEIFGGAISQPFVTAVEKGCRQALQAGALAGFPMTGVKAVVYDGKEHPVDSKEIAFQIAGRECFKRAALGAGPVLLEPIYEVEVTVPSENMGDIMGDLNSRRARVLGMEQEATRAIVKAEVPLAEVQTYSADLRSMTQGRGVFALRFLRYGRVPAHLQEQIVADHRKAQEES
ncbi:MAG: elongation factor G, partial [Candidatus Promineifilaceae bacterium]|nr:elongation factor G [Candidatus Promineifilaceae bacterium]